MNFYKNKVILITGGTGSIGQRLANFLNKNTKAKKIIIYSRDEQKHFLMQQNIPSNRFRHFIGDIRDIRRLTLALKNVDYVFHAAAQKHVEMSEYNPQECVNTNIYGTQNLIEACISNNVKKCLLISTDKAVNPINLYGGTKLVAEKIFLNANNLSGKNGCKFSVTRYGNVVGSKGSIVPFFISLIKKKQTIPLTHKEMTRFWISFDEAVQLIVNVMKISKPFEIYVPKLKSIRIIDLIKMLSQNTKIKIIGVRKGEKIHEELLTANEAQNAKWKKNYCIINTSIKKRSNNKKILSYSSDKFLMNQKEINKLYNGIIKTTF